MRFVKHVELYSNASKYLFTLFILLTDSRNEQSSRVVQLGDKWDGHPHGPPIVSI